MHSEDAEIDHSTNNNNKSKVLGVIVLTDNRQTPPQDKKRLSQFRWSAFRQTQVDPLSSESNGQCYSQDENLVVELTRRVTFLERRMEALSKNEVLGQDGARDENPIKKKNRRKFKDLQRSHECSVCKKVYGSQTSLKYHLKLKHSNEKSHSQVQ